MDGRTAPATSIRAGDAGHHLDAVTAAMLRAGPRQPGASAVQPLPDRPRLGILLCIVSAATTVAIVALVIGGLRGPSSRIDTAESGMVDGLRPAPPPAAVE